MLIISYTLLLSTKRSTGSSSAPLVVASYIGWLYEQEGFAQLLFIFVLVSLL